MIRSKYIITIIFIIFFTKILHAQTHSIDFFTGTWEEVLEKAKSQNKYIFVDCYAEWCGPCKRMSKNVFTNDSVADFYNKYFINYKMDMEKGQGLTIRKKYNVSLYPTFLFVNYNEEIIHRAIGAKSVKDFIKLGKIALDTNINFYSFYKKYKSGNKNPELLYNYAIACYEAGVAFDANEYFSTQIDDSLVNEKNWKIISYYTSVITSREFKYLCQNRKLFSKRYGDYLVNEKIFKVFVNDLVYRSKTEANINIDKIVNKVVSPVELDIKNLIKLRLKMYYFQHISGKWDDYIIVAIQYVEEVKVKNMSSYELNNISQNICFNTFDMKILGNVEKWLVESIKIDDNYLIHDTYANILFKLGKFKESLNAANEAVVMAEKTKTDCAKTKQLINRINNIKN